MPETSLDPEEVEKIKSFISKLSEEVRRILQRPEIDLDLLFPQYAPFEKNKEPQDVLELDNKVG